MNSVRASAPQLADITPYDPKYLPARAYLSANENPCDVETEVRNEIKREINKVAFNRYPDPLANELRDMIAEANGLDRDCVLVGNGGDELLFDIALAWGGPGRKFLNMPPTFSVYQNNAELTNTEVVDIPRRADYTIDEEAVLSRVARGDIDYVIVTSPNNPTGTVLNAEQLKVWVDYANANDAIIMFDAAYERFITEEGVPHSIYEVEGAKTCAIEFRSFSKTAGFTGARCGYTVVPKELVRDGQSLNAMWNRRQCTKFNGASYIIQRGAAAIYTEEGERQIEETLAYYRNNARVIKEGLEAAGFTVYGAVNSPYIWCKTPEGVGSWEFFDKLLTEANIITTPGAGFGPSGEGYVRLTAFGDADATVEAMERIQKLMAN